VATRPEHVAAGLARLPEVMCLGVSSANQLMGPLERASVLVVGPGLGQAAWGRSLLSAVANASCRKVWDADALNLLARSPLAAQWQRAPHPGRRRACWGFPPSGAGRPARCARKLARKYASVCVLKGAGTLVADPPGSWRCAIAVIRPWPAPGWAMC
jgi:ADP-dependent NAD(P)H-hydrate dehydratase